MTRNRILTLLGVGILGVGLVLGLQVRDVFSGSNEVEQLRKIEEAYQYITRSYVEQVDSAQLAEDAIEGMLAGLDPHSIYISAREMRDVRESFNASFEGIGIYYEFVQGRENRDTLVVLMPISGGPSDEAGLQAGDRIVQIGDTTAIGLNQDLVQRHLKGPKGSQVSLQVRRPGYRGTLQYTITRDQIPLNTVIASYMIDEQTGYIRLQRFARSSSTEIRQSIDALRAEGMRKLVFDLRDNAGGLLDQAYEIADEFLPAGDMIVYTESRHANNRRQYRATAGGHFERDPVIVLINENAASASEIVAGALQDHDRALIVGRRSFGKGLVQQQFPMTDGSVLQMTVSRYFTPSGRLIQTPYHIGDGEEAYFAAKLALREAVEDRVAPNGGMVNASAFGGDVPDSLVYKTDGGRTVFGGGGILPDYLVNLDSIPKALQVVIGKSLDSDFARVFLERQGARFRSSWDGREKEFVRSFSLDDAAFRSFLEFAETKGVRVVESNPDPTDRDVLVRSEVAASRAEIDTRIRAFIARRLYTQESFYPVIGEMDPVLQAAIRQWPAAESLASRGR